MQDLKTGVGAEATLEGPFPIRRELNLIFTTRKELPAQAAMKLRHRMRLYCMDR